MVLLFESFAKLFANLANDLTNALHRETHALGDVGVAQVTAAIHETEDLTRRGRALRENALGTRELLFTDEAAQRKRVVGRRSRSLRRARGFGRLCGRHRARETWPA